MASAATTEERRGAGQGITDPLHLETDPDAMSAQGLNFLHNINRWPVGQTVGGQCMQSQTGTVVQHSGDGPINLIQNNAILVEAQHEAKTTMAGPNMVGDKGAGQVAQGTQTARNQLQSNTQQNPEPKLGGTYRLTPLNTLELCISNTRQTRAQKDRLRTAANAFRGTRNARKRNSRSALGKTGDNHQADANRFGVFHLNPRRNHQKQPKME